MRPKFIVTSGVMAALVFTGWQLGLFDKIPSFGFIEYVMIAFLTAYALFAAAAGFLGRWDTCRHIANGLPMWALGFTGLGLILAVADLHALTPQALASVFRNLGFAILPNMVGVALMAGLRELAYWSANEHV